MKFILSLLVFFPLTVIGQISFKVSNEIYYPDISIKIGPDVYYPDISIKIGSDVMK